jgi:hypothetical protein
MLTELSDETLKEMGKAQRAPLLTLREVRDAQKFLDDTKHEHEIELLEAKWSKIHEGLIRINQDIMKVDCDTKIKRLFEELEKAKIPFEGFSYIIPAGEHSAYQVLKQEYVK